MAPEKKFTNISEEFLGNFSAKLSLNAHFNCSNCHFLFSIALAQSGMGDLYWLQWEKTKARMV